MRDNGTANDGLGQPPAQLPADITDFTGRDRELGRLLRRLAPPEQGADPGAADRGTVDRSTAGLGAVDRSTAEPGAAEPGAARVVVIVGAAGLGKTTLAVHAAHQVRDRFPDGQLYADLGGTRAEPVPPGEVLSRFLRDLGVNGDQVPDDEAERAALYQARLAGRRVLILLDDVPDVARVRPLLPGRSSGAAVLATTRNAGLSSPGLSSPGPSNPGLSGAGAEFIGLGSLSGAEARTLFSRIVDDGRPEAEPEATEEVLAACAGLPLAVRVCAARLATRRRWGIGTMAARLRDERRRLDVLQLADLEVRAGFRVSYNSLKADRRRTDPARAFRLLGLWPGHRISLPAAAALTGERETDLATALGTLVDTNLLESPGPDWYRFHDLLRLFARELAQATEPWEEQQAATARLLRWYLGTALSAAECVSPHRYRMPPSEPPGPYLPLTSVETALAWYDSERASVVTACRQAAAAGLHDIAWRLPTALFPLFNRRHNWADCVTVSRIALESARAAGNRCGQAWAMNNLGVALARTGDPEGLGLAAEALALRQEIGDREGEAQSAVLLPDAYYKLRGPQAAFGHSLRCLEIMRKIGKPAVLGVGLNNHGEFCLELDRLDEAADAFTEALGILREIGAYGHGHALGNLGQVYLRSGRPDDAIAALTEAHRLHLSSGDLLGQAIALKRLGLAQDRVGQAEAARESLTSALRLFEELKEDTEAARIRRDLGRGGPDNAASRCLPKATQCPWPTVPRSILKF